MDLGFVGDTVLVVLKGMHDLFGLEGMVGVLIGFLLYALYHNIRSQLFKLIIIGVVILLVWGVAVYITTGKSITLPAFNETLAQIENITLSNSTQIAT